MPILVLHATPDNSSLRDALAEAFRGTRQADHKISITNMRDPRFNPILRATNLAAASSNEPTCPRTSTISSQSSSLSPSLTHRVNVRTPNHLEIEFGHVQDQRAAFLGQESRR